MNFIFHLLLDAAVIFGLAYIMPQVEVKSFTTALLVALLLAVLNFFLGWLLYYPLHTITFFMMPFIVRLVVTALLLKLVDKVMGSFTIAGFWPALVIALAVALVGMLIDESLAKPEPVTTTTATALLLR